MARTVQTVRPDDDVALARQMMIWGGYRHLPVVSGAELVGILSDRDVAARDADAPRGERQSVGELMTRYPQTARREDSVSATAKRMVEERIDCLPVTVDGELVGIVTSTDLLVNESRKHYGDDVSSLTASDVMSAPPLMARVDDPLRWALRAMIENDVRHLPVIDRAGVLVGMLSDRDVRTALGDPLEMLARGPTSGIEEMDVESVMTVDAVALRPDAPIREVAACLLHQRLGAVPVIDERERVVGVVSYVDLLRQMMVSLG
jgi:CBS domain-containing protein